MNPTIRRLALPVSLATAALLQGCAAAIPLLINAAAADPKGTADLAKDLTAKAKAALTPSDAASAPAAAATAATTAKAGITRLATACPAPATSAQGQAATAQGQSPAARAAAAKIAGGTRVAQATQLIGAASDAAALAKNAAGAIDGSCVTLTVGQGATRKDGKTALADNKPKTVLSFNLAAPNCTTGNIAGSAWSSLKGIVSNDAKAEATAREAACANDKTVIQNELAAAGTKASGDYRVRYKLPANAPVTYTIQSSTVDLSAALQNAATGAVTQQVQQVIPANAGAAVVRELIKK